MKKICAALAVLALAMLLVKYDPRLFLRSSYVAIARADIKIPQTWELGLTDKTMCAATQNGDSPAFRYDLHFSYLHWSELFMQGKEGMTQTLICKYQDAQGTRYERLDWRRSVSYQPEVVWHGFRQRGDVDIP
jgi:hypothetical protein